MIKPSDKFNGVVHGRTIKLDGEPGLPDGQSVRVTLEPTSEAIETGEGLRRAFGAWADDAKELDEWLEWNRQQRKQSRSENEQ